MWARWWEPRTYLSVPNSTLALRSFSTWAIQVFPASTYLLLAVPRGDCEGHYLIPVPFLLVRKPPSIMLVCRVVQARRPGCLICSPSAPAVFSAQAPYIFPEVKLVDR